MFGKGKERLLILAKITYQKTGEYHSTNGFDNQDAVIKAESKTAEIVVIADGVSSCINSKRGAEIACKAVSEIMLNETEYIFSSSKEKIAGLLSAYVYKELMAEAKNNNQPVESYSSTLSFVCYNKISGEVMTFMLGDSLIFLIKKDNIFLACTPELFEYCKTYATTTKDVAKVIEINILSPKDNICYLLATDGAWKTFYSGSVLSEEVGQAVKEENIIGYLEKQSCKDDCSIVMIDIPKGA